MSTHPSTLAADASAATASSDPRRRLLVFAAVVLLCLALAAGYAWHASRRNALPLAHPEAAASVPLDALPQDAPGAPHRRYLLFRSTAGGGEHGRVGLQFLDDPDEPRRVAAALNCDRVHVAAGRGICLEAVRGTFTTYRARVFDERLQVRHTQSLAGPPSRARMSADGRLAAMTVFVTGHSYGGVDFTTRTSILDTSSGAWLADDLERFEVLRDGQPIKAADFNFWGVTFAPDGKRFYATLQTAGKLYLVEGDLAARRMRIIYDNVECPSLSPDGRRVGFKRRIPGEGLGRFRWRIHVLDLATRKETALAAETRNVDDQIEWLGNDEVVYALPSDANGGGAATDLWALRADGTGAPRLLLTRAFSPAVVR